MKTGLDAVLRPDRVAIVGASSDPSRIGGKLIQFLKRGGFAGALYPINPKQPEIQGLTAYATLADTPHAPDLAVIVLAAPAVPGAVDEAIARGARGIIIMSGGFAETGPEGKAAEEQIRARCAAAGVALLGPNCLGVANHQAALTCTFSTVLESTWPKAGGIALVTQSGAIGSYCYGLGADRGLGFSKWIATGNEAGVDVADCIAWLAGDEHTRVILAHLEGCKDGRKLVRALEAAVRAGKRVVVMKVGDTEAGARAALSHTATLAGEEPIWDAVLRAAGVCRVRSIEEMLDVAYACAAPLPATPTVGIVTGSGGVGVMLADAASSHGLQLPPLPMAAQRAIKTLIPFASTGNPIDATGQILNDIAVLTAIIAIVLEQGGYGSIVIFLQFIGRAPQHFDRIKEPLIASRQRFADKPFVLCGSLTPEGRAEMEQAGFLVFEDPLRCVRALAALSGFARSVAHPLPTQLREPPPTDGPPLAPGRTLDEVEARELLRAAGVPFVEGRLVRTQEEALHAARALGYPVVLKVVSADIAHKSDVGGVALGLADDQALCAAWERTVDNVKRHAPSAQVRGMFVSRMVSGGVETLLGLVHDPVFGPVVSFGLGGVLVELLRDVAFRLAPLDLAAARAMIREIRGFPVLDGARGRPRVDTEAIAQALVALAAFGAQQSGVAIDINPFLALPDGGVAVDALMATAPLTP